MSTVSIARDAQYAVTELWAMAGRFVAWLENTGYRTYDPYDIWGTRFGVVARRLYYRKNPLGLAMTAPLILMEMVLPQLRRLLVRKDRYPTADAQLALAFLNLHEITREHEEGGASRAYSGRTSESWLIKSRELADDLLTESVPGYSGLGWGYPFDWQNVGGLMRKGTPHITATPYC